MEFQRFKPTIAWLEEHYDILNEELFSGMLGPCKLDIFTTGRGSMGRYLGYFTMEQKGLRVNRRNRRLQFGSTEIYQVNFCEICKPKIAINGNYSWTEDALTNTLVHEMCHYYTYMFGICPKQAHGPEFRQIAYEVSKQSGGRITIQRLASAEKMSQLELDADIQAKNQKREDNKKSKMTALLVYMTNGDVQLTLTTSHTLIDKIVKYFRYSDMYYNRAIDKICISNNAELINFLFDKGYKRAFRTHRYWNIGDKPWIGQMAKWDYDMQVILPNRNSSLAEAQQKSVKQIIKEVIDQYFQDEDEDCIPLTPGMNLGLKSPLEDAI